MTGDSQKNREENRRMCICEPCPSYNECMRADESLLFCVNGRAERCTFEKKGCLCPACPVTKKLRLEKTYYCIMGSGLDQR